jgi:hypothetical protein
MWRSRYSLRREEHYERDRHLLSMEGPLKLGETLAGSHDCLLRPQKYPGGCLDLLILMQSPRARIWIQQVARRIDLHCLQSWVPKAKLAPQHSMRYQT